MAQPAATPFFDAPALLAPRAAVREELPGGAFVLRSPEPLRRYGRCAGEWLERWARETPDAPAFGEPAVGGGWTVLPQCQQRSQPLYAMMPYHEDHTSERGLLRLRFTCSVTC